MIPDRYSDEPFNMHEASIMLCVLTCWNLERCSSKNVVFRWYYSEFLHVFMNDGQCWQWYHDEGHVVQWNDSVTRGRMSVTSYVWRVMNWNVHKRSIDKQRVWFELIHYKHVIIKGTCNWNFTSEWNWVSCFHALDLDRRVPGLRHGDPGRTLSCVLQESSENWLQSKESITKRLDRVLQYKKWM